MNFWNIILFLLNRSINYDYYYYHKSLPFTLAQSAHEMRVVDLYVAVYDSTTRFRKKSAMSFQYRIVLSNRIDIVYDLLLHASCMQ